MAMEKTVRGGVIEPFEGEAPGGIAGDAAGRRDRRQPPARREHGEGGTEVTQIRLMAARDKVTPIFQTKTFGPYFF